LVLAALRDEQQVVFKNAKVAAAVDEINLARWHSTCKMQNAGSEGQRDQGKDRRAHRQLTTDEEEIMYKKMLIPLDGSKTAEAVLPYARTLARKLNVAVELVGVVDVAALAAQVSRANNRYFDTIISESVLTSEAYLKRIATTFPNANVKCTTEKGRPEEVILEKASEKTTLVTMATHGRSGINRFLLGSIAEKVLRAATSPILLIRGGEEVNNDGEATLNSVIVPLDGSKLAETVLPNVIALARELGLEVILLRAYKVPVNIYASSEDYYPVEYEEIKIELMDEARNYLEKKVAELKRFGIAKVSHSTPEGLGADEIIALGRKLPDNLIAMCTHGRSGIGRWVLGSVTETVVRHSGDPVLVLRAG
jgi:nucleotide-binding universal stress UspA family protein